MPKKKPKRKVFVCSKCGREITISIYKITDKQNTFLCDACYCNTMFPEIKDYNHQFFDIDPSDR